MGTPWEGLLTVRTQLMTAPNGWPQPLSLKVEQFRTLRPQTKLDFLGTPVPAWLSSLSCFPLSLGHFFTLKDQSQNMCSCLEWCKHTLSRAALFWISNKYVLYGIEATEWPQVEERLKQRWPQDGARCLNSSFVSGRNTLQDILKCGNETAQIQPPGCFVQAVTKQWSLHF